MRRALLLCVLALTACPTVRRPSTADFNASGTVYAGGLERTGDPLEGVRVTLWVAGAPAPSAQTHSTAEGTWGLTLGSPAADRVVLAFEKEGWAPAYQALQMGPWAEVSLPLALEPLEPLDCSSGDCTGESDDVAVESPPAGATGVARALDPALDGAGLPGLEGLRAVAAAFVQLDGGDFDPDAGGMPGDGGAEPPPVLRLRVPFRAWGRLDDARAGTGRVEVPLRRFDPVAGAWADAGVATLWTESGLPVPESALGLLRAGTFGGGAVARAELGGTGTYALAFPAASRGCVQGLAEVDGQPAEGVVVSVAGHEATTSGAGGRFCAAAPQGAGGAQGATGAQYGAVRYVPADLPLPTEPGSCGGPCRDVGAVRVDASAQALVRTCSIQGTVTDGAGTPLPGAVVVGLDDGVPGNVFNSLCGKLGSRCTLSATSDEQGAFALKLPLQSGALLRARALVEQPGQPDGVRAGAVRVEDCAQAAVALPLWSGHDALAVTVALAGQTLTWDPPRPAWQVRAVQADGGVAWALESAGGMAPPLTWGSVPAGATQTAPAVGAPDAPRSGDEVEVQLQGVDGRGVRYTGGGATLVP